MAEGPLSPQERAALRARVAGLAHRPALAVVCLGELPAWVRQDCAVCGVYCEGYALPPGMGEGGLTELLAELARRPGLDGVLLWPLEKNAAAPTWAQALGQVVEAAERRK